MLQIIIDHWQRAIKENNLYRWAVLYEQIEAFNGKGGYDAETYLELDFMQTIVYQIYSDMHKEATTKGVRH